MMRRLGAWVAVLVFAAGAPSHEAAAEPAQKVKVLDLVSHVEDLSGKVESTAGNVSDISSKLRSMIGSSKNIAVKQSRTEVRIELASDVLFDFDSASIQAKARPALTRIARFIRGNAKGEVRILGYTDGKGSAAYNQQLSERRARAVETWFVEKDGLHRNAFVTQGFGARNPVAPNTKPDGSDDPQGRQKNRRVEIVIHK